MKAKFVKDFLFEDVIDQDKIEVDIDYGVSRTEHSTERQSRHEEYISNEEIVDNVKAALDKITKKLIFNQLNIGDRVLIKNLDTNLNIVGVPTQGGDIIMFKLITVMREPNFRNIKDTPVIRIHNEDIENTDKDNLNVEIDDSDLPKNNI